MSGPSRSRLSLVLGDVGVSRVWIPEWVGEPSGEVRGEVRLNYSPDAPAGFTFHPCVHDTLSGGGEGARAFQRILAMLAAMHTNVAPRSSLLIGLKALDVRQRVRCVNAGVCGQRYPAVRQVTARGSYPERRYRGGGTQATPRCENGSFG